MFILPTLRLALYTRPRQSSYYDIAEWFLEFYIIPIRNFRVNLLSLRLERIWQDIVFYCEIFVKRLNYKMFVVILLYDRVVVVLFFFLLNQNYKIKRRPNNTRYIYLYQKLFSQNSSENDFQFILIQTLTVWIFCNIKSLKKLKKFWNFSLQIPFTL